MGFPILRIHSGISFIQKIIYHLSVNSTLLSYSKSITSTGLIHGLIHFYLLVRILGRIPDKSFPSCYSQSSLQLCLEISISSNSRNVLRISSNSSNLYILYFYCSVTVHCKGERRKPGRKPYPLPYV
jgi:hypothetical protein